MQNIANNIYFASPIEDSNLTIKDREENVLRDESVKAVSDKLLYIENSTFIVKDQDGNTYAAGNILPEQEKQIDILVDLPDFLSKRYDEVGFTIYSGFVIGLHEDTEEVWTIVKMVTNAIGEVITIQKYINVSWSNRYNL